MENENNNYGHLQKYIDLVKEVPYLKLVRRTKIKYTILIIIQCIFIYTFIAGYFSMKDSNVCAEMSKDAQALYILITLGFYIIIMLFEQLACTIFNSIIPIVFVIIVIILCKLILLILI